MNEKLVINAVSPKVGYSYASMATYETTPVTGGVAKPTTPKSSTQTLVKPPVWKRDSKLVRLFSFGHYGY